MWTTGPPLIPYTLGPPLSSHWDPLYTPYKRAPLPPSQLGAILPTKHTRITPLPNPKKKTGRHQSRSTLRDPLSINFASPLDSSTTYTPDPLYFPHTGPPSIPRHSNPPLPHTGPPPLPPHWTPPATHPQLDPLTASLHHWRPLSRSHTATPPLSPHRDPNLSLHTGPPRTPCHNWTPASLTAYTGHPLSPITLDPLSRSVPLAPPLIPLTQGDPLASLHTWTPLSRTLGHPLDPHTEKVPPLLSHPTGDPLSYPPPHCAPLCLPHTPTPSSPLHTRTPPLTSTLGPPLSPSHNRGLPARPHTGPPSTSLLNTGPLSLLYNTGPPSPAHGTSLSSLTLGPPPSPSHRDPSLPHTSWIPTRYHTRLGPPDIPTHWDPSLIPLHWPPSPSRLGPHLSPTLNEHGTPLALAPQESAPHSISNSHWTPSLFRTPQGPPIALTLDPHLSPTLVYPATALTHGSPLSLSTLGPPLDSLTTTPSPRPHTWNPLSLLTLETPLTLPSHSGPLLSSHWGPSSPSQLGTPLYAYTLGHPLSSAHWDPLSYPTHWDPPENFALTTRHPLSTILTPGPPSRFSHTGLPASSASWTPSLLRTQDPPRPHTWDPPLPSHWTPLSRLHYTSGIPPLSRISHMDPSPFPHTGPPLALTLEDPTLSPTHWNPISRPSLPHHWNPLSPHSHWAPSLRSLQLEPPLSPHTGTPSLPSPLDRPLPHNLETPRSSTQREHSSTPAHWRPPLSRYSTPDHPRAHLTTLDHPAHPSHRTEPPRRTSHRRRTPPSPQHCTHLFVSSPTAPLISSHDHDSDPPPLLSHTGPLSLSSHWTPSLPHTRPPLSLPHSDTLALLTQHGADSLSLHTGHTPSLLTPAPSLPHTLDPPLPHMRPSRRSHWAPLSLTLGPLSPSHWPPLSLTTGPLSPSNGNPRSPPHWTTPLSTHTGPPLSLTLDPHSLPHTRHHPLSLITGPPLSPST
uniref:Uncharacterized protein n=1 Tax=Knipowitschia caucasica TaxID=637954 RepID=A0AAV2L341_KNICA